MNPHEQALLEDLNPPQREAVLHGDGPLLVLSGAGSGKTRVITRRVAHLVKVRRVFPWRILAVTFTNKAAREMRERLVQLLGAQAHDLVVSTFHSSAAMILRREAEAVGLTRSFVIYDDGDQLQVVKRALREVGVDQPIQPREVLHRIDQEKNAARLPDDMRLDVNDVRGRLVQKVYRAYQKLLRAANAVDFGDLLLLLVKLFQQRPDVLERYRQRFLHVLVDEFQDTNPVQYELLRLLAPPPSANLVVVGDDDQSIYRWRGANVDNILDFPSLYPGARVVKLEQNYRSDQNILEAAHAVISHNKRRMTKKLWSDRPRGEHLQLLIQRDERAEAQEVARQIHALAREGFIKYSGMAVFYRVNAQSRVLEEALRLARVPYTLVSGRSFYDRAEVRDAAAYLRLMANPRSDADLLRVINTPARGIGDTTVERLTDYANAAGVSLYEAIASPERIPALNAAAVKRLGGFHALLESLHGFAQDAKDAASAVDRMLKETRLVESLLAEGSDESLTRAENLREFNGAAQEFDLNRAAAAVAAAEAAQGAEPPPPEVDAAPLTADVPPLQAFLEQISLVGEADAEVGEGKVALMTLHAAKGLEFDAVFLTGMEDGVFPHSRALNVENPDEGEEMAEERRLCYVGFTRARRRLFISFAQSRALFGELRYNPPSRFLRDVPPTLFGLEPEAAQAPQRPSMAPVAPKRRAYEEDEGPRIDRSYSQASDMDGVGGDVRGMRVRHEQFGVGRIIDANGSGPNAKLTVDFGGAVGLKRVIARFLMPG
ncbi:UvrD-helicase domain-containing protein [Myxococcaceae bacterium GXIMD 01537]